MKKDRKSLSFKSPILRNCMYIVVPIIAFVAFKFIGSGVQWAMDIMSKVGWPILITFVITSLFWACFYGLKESKRAKNKDEDAAEDEEDNEEDNEDIYA